METGKGEGGKRGKGEGFCEFIYLANVVMTRIQFAVNWSHVYRAKCKVTFYNWGPIC